MANLQDERPPDETEAQRALRVAVLKELTENVVSLLQDGREVRLGLDVDRQAERITLDFGLTANPDSKLHQVISELAKGRDGLPAASPDAAIRFAGSWPLPVGVGKTLVPVLQEQVRKDLAPDEQKGWRQLAVGLLQSLEPTFTSGSLSATMDWLGPNAKERYTMLAAVAVKDGAAVEMAVRQGVKQLSEPDRKGIELDAESIGDVKVHRLDLLKYDRYPKDFREVFGEHPLYVAFRPNAVLFALGEEAVPALKRALVRQSKGTPGIRLDLAMNRLATPGLHGGSQEVPRIAKEVFGGGKDNDQFRVSAEGGKALRVRVQLHGAVLKFFSRLPPNGQ
jgi:hypothetical protein